MSRFSITIGNKTFSSKTSALKFYKSILDKYSYKESLDNEDSKHLIALCYKSFWPPEEIEDFAADVIANFSNSSENTDDKILSVIVDRHPEFRTTKCFYFVGYENNEMYKDIFSYRMAINGAPTDLQSFSRACRFLVHKRIREFKIEQFKNKPVKCAISGVEVEWDDCQVDHKSPLTFSVIIKSFIISNDIDISKIEYSYNNSKEIFLDREMSEKFNIFHMKMAVLRIISTKENAKLSSSARVKPTNKDGVLTSEANK